VFVISCLWWGVFSILLRSHICNVLCGVCLGGTIFAFGDSLTEGMTYKSVHHNKSSFHPYANVLRTLVPKTTVIESGVVGERVESMRNRLRVEMKERDLTRPLVVVILGGTNNIGGMHSSPASTARDLLGMHEDLHALQRSASAGASGSSSLHTVAVTLPTFPMDHFRQIRLELNALIRDFAAQSSGFTLLLDIEDLFLMRDPCRRSSGSSSGSSNSKVKSKDKDKEADGRCRENTIPFDPANRQFWDPRSPLHFSEAGYDALGRIVFERLCGADRNRTYFTK
jgi:hypothetical protein